MTKEEIEEIINEWLKEWCVLVPEDQLRQEENQVQEDNSDEENKEKDPRRIRNLQRVIPPQYQQT